MNKTFSKSKVDPKLFWENNSYYSWNPLILNTAAIHQGTSIC